MSANESDLSNAAYGYDFVVATTQASINATLKQYLYNTTFPMVQMYWNQDANGNPVPVSRADLLTQTKGTDPLTVPSWNNGEPKSPDIENISSSNFYFAFEASIGIPSGLQPQNIPDIITLQPASQSVIFSLICEQFTVVTCNFGRQGLESFMSSSQPADAPWLFTSVVAMKQILNNSNLPPLVQKQLDDFGPSAFSVQQLLFDLDNANLESTPTIEGVVAGSPTETQLQQVFAGAYFAAMKSSGQPILSYSILQSPSGARSTLNLTNMALEVSPYTPTAAATARLNTLCYLCETDGHGLPPAVPFSWSWIEPAEQSSCDGVVSINRNTFAGYFQDQLTSYVFSNCYQPSVQVSLSDLDSTVNYSWSMTPGQPPTIVTPATGEQVLTYSYNSSASDEAGLGGDMGAMTLTSTYNATVTFTGATVVIHQQLVVSIYVRGLLGDSENWNAINKSLTDTYTLALSQDGGLTASKTSVPVDNSDPTPSTNGFVSFFTGLNDLTSDIASWTSTFSPTSLESMPLSVAQQFIFPGGGTFAFKDVTFSNNQDLVAHITYAQPGA